MMGVSTIAAHVLDPESFASLRASGPWKKWRAESVAKNGRPSIEVHVPSRRLPDDHGMKQRQPLDTVVLLAEGFDEATMAEIQEAVDVANGFVPEEVPD
jgi:hypothetical protein